LNGPACLKLLDNIDSILWLAQEEEKEKYQTLFYQFNAIIGFLLTTKPLRSVDLSEQEYSILYGPVVLDQFMNPLRSDENQLEALCHEHGSFYAKAFRKLQIPKHHIMVCHIPQFVKLHGSIGLFSEQGIERIHSSFNSLNRRFRTITNKEQRVRLRFRESVVVINAIITEKGKRKRGGREEHPRSPLKRLRTGDWCCQEWKRDDKKE